MDAEIATKIALDMKMGSGRRRSPFLSCLTLSGRLQAARKQTTGKEETK